MTMNDKIRDEKLQYDIDRQARKISALSSGKIDKYEYVASDEILVQRQIIEQAKFAYSSLEKASKTIKDLEEKQIKAKNNKIIKKTLI